MARKQSGQVFFLFFSPRLILQFTEGVQWFYYRENYTFPRIQRGSNISRGGGSNFSRGVQMLISTETHITCDFPGVGGGGPAPLSHLWIRKCKITQYCISAGVVLLYLLYLLVWRLTISRVCWYDVSLSAMPAGVVLHYRPCLSFGTSLLCMPVGVVPRLCPGHTFTDHLAGSSTD